MAFSNSLSRVTSTKRAIEADERIKSFYTRQPIRREGEDFHSSRRAHKGICVMPQTWNKRTTNQRSPFLFQG